MQRKQILSLLAEAAQAADLRCGCLLDHKDLRLMVGRLVTAAQKLLNENDQLKDRLTRRYIEASGPDVPIPSINFGAADPASSYHH